MSSTEQRKAADDIMRKAYEPAFAEMDRQVVRAGYAQGLDPRYAEALDAFHTWTRWLSAIRYKPGFRLELVFRQQEFVSVLQVSAQLFDSTKGADAVSIERNAWRMPSRQQAASLSGNVLEDRPIGTALTDGMFGPLVEVGMSQVVPAYLIKAPRRTFVLWVRDVLTEVELHERDEWFRLDGELFDDPHARDRA